jgi:ribosomal-protein-alanine N-acetyltransferase
MLRQTRLPAINTQRCHLRLLEPHQAELMLQFRQANREHLARWEPRRSSEFFTAPFWEIQLRIALKDFRLGQSLCLVILDPAEQEVMGVCNYTNMVRGTFQSCHLGYALSHRYEGQGIMREALQGSLDYVFNELRLHRVMANYLPHNDRSGELLKRLGFKIEGYGEQYLKINGRWEDHVLTALLNPLDVDQP